MRAPILFCCIAASLSVAAAFAAETRPPRQIGRAGNAVENCKRLHGGGEELVGEVQVAVSVGANGRVTGASSESGTPPSLAAAAECVAVTLLFEPAQEAGRSVAGKASVEIGFPTRPQLRHDLRRAVEYCQPALQPLVTLNDAYEGAFDLVVRVGRDGRVAETALPEGVLPWMEEAARCLAARLEFFPARLGLEAVESWVRLPVDFNLSRNPHERVRLEAPTLRSDEPAILESYRACYPPGRDDQARIGYRITVTEGGRVRKAEVVRSSGDPVLDEAGACILRRLLFVPARRNGVNVEATLGWPILVRPPG